MHDGIDVPALGEHVRHRLPEVPRLRRQPILLVDLQMRLRHAGLDAVGSMIDEHDVLHDECGANRRAEELFRRCQGRGQESSG